MNDRSSSKTELSQQVVALGYRFVQRWDMYARQLDDGRYVCIRKPLSLDHIFAHLSGFLTLGGYVLDQKSQARFVVLDADDENGYSRLKFVAGKMSDDDIPSYLEKSRRGGHLWIFLPGAVMGKNVRVFGQGLLQAYDCEDVELFPKQDTSRDGPGSLIRLPFGIHRVSGQRYGFYSVNGVPVAPTLRQQIIALSAPETIPETAFQHFQSVAPSGTVETPKDISDRPGDDIANRIKTRISVFEFVSHYIELRPTSNGAIGLCPFHDDQKPSFSVNAKGNYWKCFAGCGSGSIIDFWMKWQGCDFITAVRQLSDMLI